MWVFNKNEITYRLGKRNERASSTSRLHVATNLLRLANALRAGELPRLHLRIWLKMHQIWNAQIFEELWSIILMTSTNSRAEGSWVYKYTRHTALFWPKQYCNLCRRSTRWVRVSGSFLLPHLGSTMGLLIGRSLCSLRDGIPEKQLHSGMILII
jgi:hypothetical protein